jgi:hypothetical protein
MTHYFFDGVKLVIFSYIIYEKQEGNIAHVKETKYSNFLLKNNNYLIKSYIFKIKCTSFNTNLLF